MNILKLKKILFVIVAVLLGGHVYAAVDINCSVGYLVNPTAGGLVEELYVSPADSRCNGSWGGSDTITGVGSSATANASLNAHYSENGSQYSFTANGGVSANSTAHVVKDGDIYWTTSTYSESRVVQYFQIVADTPLAYEVTLNIIDYGYDYGATHDAESLYSLVASNRTGGLVHLSANDFSIFMEPEQNQGGMMTYHAAGVLDSLTGYNSLLVGGDAHALAGSLFSFSSDSADFSGWYTDYGIDWNYTLTVTPVPVPTVGWLFGSAVVSMLALARKRG